MGLPLLHFERTAEPLSYLQHWQLATMLFKPANTPRPQRT